MVRKISDKEKRLVVANMTPRAKELHAQSSPEARTSWWKEYARYHPNEKSSLEEIGQIAKYKKSLAGRKII